MQQRYIQPVERPRCYVIRVEGGGAPKLAYRIFARSQDEAAAQAIADYNRLFHVSDGKPLFDDPAR